MPSTINTSTTYSAVNNTAPASPLVQSIFKRKTMSITQTYYLAHKARSKLSHEAARPDHNLRLLVGHANMLDSLMLELADAEREQESWFNQSVRGASESQTKTQNRHVQWADTVVEDPEEDWEAEDAGSDTSSETSEDSDDGFDAEDDIEMPDAVALTRVPSNQFSPPSSPETEDFDELDDEEDFAKLVLVRTSSHQSTISSPPELDHDSDSSEDESMPPSPPTVVLPAFQQDTKSAPSPAADKSFYDDGFYLPPRTSTASLVTAISVY